MWKPLIILLVLTFGDPAWSASKAKKDRHQSEHIRFDDWDFFKINIVVNNLDQTKRTICYLVSVPISTSDNRSVDRKSAYRKGEPYLLITNSETAGDEISTSSGFMYTLNSDVEISFGQKKFYLFPYLEIAWSYHRIQDIDIIKQMQISEEAVVTAVDKNNQLFSDSYSLIGFIPAYQQMKKDCRET